jgi:hypothetical protein
MLPLAIVALLLSEAPATDFLRIPPVKIFPIKPPAFEVRAQGESRTRTCYHMRILKPNIEAMAPMPGMRGVPAIDSKFSIPAPPACDLLKQERSLAR